MTLSIPADGFGSFSRGSAAGTQCDLRLEEHTLPAKFQWARDVRWSTPGNVFLAVPDQGVYRLGLTSAAAVLEIPRGRDSNGLWAPGFIGASDTHLVAAAPFFSAVWKVHGQKGLAGVIAVPEVADVDSHEERMLLVGLQGDKKPSPDGAIAWLRTLEKADASSMLPVLFSADGPGATSMNTCGQMGVSAARFMSDGSFVIVPGVEEGATWFAADGHLLKTWSSRELGFDSVCSLTDDETKAYRLGVRPRQHWVNQRRVVDEILPMEEGPAFIVRRHEQGKTAWTMRVSGGDEVVECELPFSSSSAQVRLRADVADSEAVFLLFVEGPSLAPGAEPEVQPRLLVGRIGQ